MFYSQGYTEYVLACNNGKINEFEDLKSLMNPEVKKEGVILFGRLKK